MNSLSNSPWVSSAIMASVNGEVGTVNANDDGVRPDESRFARLHDGSHGAYARKQWSKS